MVNNHYHNIQSPRDAHALGLGMVYQHFTLIPGMTVMENLVMSRSDIPAVINWQVEQKRLNSFLKKVPLSVELNARVDGLAAGEKQKVEILKQLYLNSRFIVLDEPTSVLTPQEANEILGLVNEMAHQGDITVLLITHKFREVMAYADKVTILRNGRVVGDGDVGDLTSDDMARMMIGDEALVESSDRGTAEAGMVKLKISGLSAESDAGRPAIQDINLELRGGEIVGIAGVSGNGQSELVQVLAGQREAVSGGVSIHDEPYHATRKEMRDHKLFCLPEEPLANACVPDMSVAENMAFRLFDTVDIASNGWWLNRNAFKRTALDLIAQYNVKTPGPEAAIKNLSGGNIQRAVLARELSGDVEILIAANPCFGLDFSAVADIHARIMAARNNGAAVLMVSEDLDELLKLSDRLIVISEGKFVYETLIADADRMTIGHYMAGHLSVYL